MASVTAVLAAVNALTPLGVIGLLAVIIFLLVSKRGPVRKMSDNHLHHVQASLEQIAANSDKQLEVLYDVRADIARVLGRLD